MVERALAILMLSLLCAALAIVALAGDGLVLGDLLLAGGAFTVFAVAHSIGVNVQSGSRVIGTLIALTIPAAVGGVMPHMLVAADTRDGLISPQLSLSAPVIAVAGLLRLSGVALIVWTNVLFFRRGRGTLSPQPELKTSRLVTGGPFAVARNPMILGVVLELAGIALMEGSPRVAAFVVAFVVIKNLWFSWVEEPRMQATFGAEYAAYKQRVSRWGLSLLEQ